jgi:septal ring factor EnvC (AmiA/AmiB activator)
MLIELGTIIGILNTIAKGELFFTIISSVIIICLTAMATLVKIYKKSPKQEELPGFSSYCLHNKERMDDIIKKQLENQEKTDSEFKERRENAISIKEIILELKKEIAILEKESEVQNKTLEEIKASNKNLAQRLDELLQQLIDFANV